MQQCFQLQGMAVYFSNNLYIVTTLRASDAHAMYMTAMLCYNRTAQLICCLIALLGQVMSAVSNIHTIGAAVIHTGELLSQLVSVGRESAAQEQKERRHLR